MKRCERRNVVVDPIIMEQAQDIFRELSQNEACLGPLQHRLVPTLISIMQSAIDKVPSGLHGVALDVVETLVRASQPPLSDSLMQTFPSAIQLALTSDDPTIVQVTIVVIDCYLSSTNLILNVEWW